MNNALPQDWEGFDPIPDSIPNTPRDKALTFLGSLSKGDILQVNRSHWRVYSAYGARVLLTRNGTKGRKIYSLNSACLEPLTFSVIESLGDGARLGLTADTGTCKKIDLRIDKRP